MILDQQAGTALHGVAEVAHEPSGLPGFKVPTLPTHEASMRRHPVACLLVVLVGQVLSSRLSVLGTAVPNVTTHVDVDVAGDTAMRVIVLVLFGLHDGERHYSKYLPAIRHSLIDPLARLPDTELTVVVHTTRSAALDDYAAATGAHATLVDDDDDGEMHSVYATRNRRIVESLAWVRENKPHVDAVVLARPDMWPLEAPLVRPHHLGSTPRKLWLAFKAWPYPYPYGACGRSDEPEPDVITHVDDNIFVVPQAHIEPVSRVLSEAAAAGTSSHVLYDRFVSAIGDPEHVGFLVEGTHWPRQNPLYAIDNAPASDGGECRR